MQTELATWRQRAYVGCRTTKERNGRGRGIVMYEVPSTGPWIQRDVAGAGENPSFLCLHPDGRFHYTVHGDREAVSAFAVRGSDGQLARLGTWPVEGRNPVHLTFSPNGKWLLVACYASGNVSCLPVWHDGRLGPVAQTLRLTGLPGPLAQHQTGSHPHQLVFDPSGHWLLVPDKGGDCVHVLTMDGESGELQVASSATFPPDSGPRHLVFNDAGFRAYLACELSSEVCFCHFDQATGQLAVVQTMSTVPIGFASPNSAAGIALAEEGQTLHVSNRGHDSIAGFNIDASTGELAATGHARTSGRTPRFITTAPHGGGVIAANEDSDNIVAVPSPQPRSAQPALSVSTLAHTGSPVCIVFTKETP